jgi:hypothetical protein
MTLIQDVGMADQLEVWLTRNGERTLLRETMPNHGVKRWVIKFGKLFGLFDRYMEDLVVNAGKAAVANLLATDSGTACFKYTGIGQDSTAPAPGQTALLNQYKRQAADTITRVTTNVANDTMQSTTTFDITDAVALVESGLFDAPSGGNMLCRQTFAPINLQNGDQVTFIWKIVVT